MTGLDEMKAAILAENKESCDKILKHARETAQTIAEEAAARAHEDGAEILKGAEEARESELKKAQSGAELEERKILLEAKAQIINDTIAEALNKLHTMPDADYFDAVTRLVLANARPGDGELRFSKRDLERIPTSFAFTLNQKLAPLGATVSISSAPAPIDNGFLLVYGDIEQNCSFKALMDAALEQVKDALYREIFG